MSERVQQFVPIKKVGTSILPKVSGDTLEGTPIGQVTPAAGAFTTGTFSGNLDVQGGQTGKVTTVNAATYDLLVTDYILNVTYPTTAAVTSLTLPTAQCVSGRLITIKDASYNAGVNNITIDTEGAEKINNGDTVVINANGDSIDIYSDGTNWHVK